MNQAIIKDKIISLEAELQYLRQAFSREPDFFVDGKNWRKIRLEVKGVRKKLYKRQYGKK